MTRIISYKKPKHSETLTICFLDALLASCLFPFYICETFFPSHLFLTKRKTIQFIMMIFFLFMLLNWRRETWPNFHQPNKKRKKIFILLIDWQIIKLDWITNVQFIPFFFPPFMTFSSWHDLETFFITVCDDDTFSPLHTSWDSLMNLNFVYFSVNTSVKCSSGEPFLKIYQR